MRIKRKLVVDTLRLVNMEPDRIWSLKKAEARASKARLLDRPAKVCCAVWMLEVGRAWVGRGGQFWP